MSAPLVADVGILPYWLTLKVQKVSPIYIMYED